MPIDRLVLVLVTSVTLPLAGCVDGGTDSASLASGAFEESGEPDVSTVAFSGEGRSEGFLCVVDACHYLESSQDVELPEGGALQTLRATVTWTPRDPTLDELEIFLFTQVAEREWSYSFEPGHYWRGTSPLEVEGEPLENAITSHFLHGRAIHRPIDGQRTGGGLSQAYAVTGEVILMPAPPLESFEESTHDH